MPPRLPTDRATSHFLKRRTWSALLLFGLLFLISGCTREVQMAQTAALGGGAIYDHEQQLYRATYGLNQRLEGTPQEVAEQYIARYQPGPEPRVFETSYVYDRQGRLLAELFDEGRRAWVPLDAIAPHMVDAVIATEDGNFYENDGVETRRMVAGLAATVSGAGVQSGGSTITMQLARNLFIPPERRFGASVERKVAETMIARDLTRLYSKDEILEMYLNLIYFGHRSYGVEAAARTYFGKAARDLTLAEATLIAGLPQTPALYDPFLDMDAAKARQRVVLDLLVRRDYLTPDEADAVFAEPLTPATDPDTLPILTPHFLTYLSDFIETMPGGGDLLRGGFTITATLDLDFQDLAQRIVRENVDALRPSYDLSNAGLVALKPGTAEILAMVGSADYANEAIGGQVNVTLAKRQPGSAIKPVLYSTALEEGIVSPATLLWDLPVQYPISPTMTYAPENYDENFRGPVTVRMALANSLNVPTIKLFDALGASTFVTTANRMGLVDLSPNDIVRAGLTMALGGAEVSLLELTTAYHTIANDGRYVAATPVLEMLDGNGTPVEVPGREDEQAISPETAYIVRDIMSDNRARAPIFGENSRLRLSRPAAAKTGTTTAFRDNWTLGFTKYLVAGVWAGNNDNRPMARVDGITGAGPIWNLFMEAVIADPNLLEVLGAPPEPEAWEFGPPPEGLVQVDNGCPAALTCREGGEYFHESWLTRTLTVTTPAPEAEEIIAVNPGGESQPIVFQPPVELPVTTIPLYPFDDSFVNGNLAAVSYETAGGQRRTVGVCVLQRLNPGEGATALAMPLGFGELELERDPSGAFVVEASRPASELVLPDGQPLPKKAIEKMREERRAAMNWAAQRGLLLSLGDCASVDVLVRALFGPAAVAVTVGGPADPGSFEALAAEISQSEGITGTEEVAAAPGGPNGIVEPPPGSVISGSQTVVAVAALPDFGKWQLDLLLNSTDATFLGLGEWPVPAPTALLTWDSARYPNGDHTLRLRVVRRDGNYDEFYVPVRVQN